MSGLTSPEFRDRLNDCIHCGLCLPACPTYEVFRTEMAAPRGRIALMKAAAEGRIGLSGALTTHLDQCLGCLSCETACPSGVQYGSLLEETREAIEAERKHSRAERFWRWLGLRQLLPHRRRLRAGATLLRVAQGLGFLRLARSPLFPELWRRAASFVPRLDGQRLDARRPAPAVGEKRGTVALFLGCVQDAVLGRVNAATARVLQHNGYEVRFPDQQTCCGAAALHLGEADLARQLAQRNVRAFAGADAVISNAGGCGAQLKNYGELLGDDSARRFEKAVLDVSEILVDQLVPPTGRIAARATYADSCHLCHAQGVVDAPRQLLRQIPGLEVVELARPDFCCGSAGVYNLTQPDIADQVLDAKMRDIAQTGARLIVTTNPGCQLQLAHGVERAGLDAEVVHLMELLDRAYGPPSTH